jgi:hypothetical protein
MSSLSELIVTTIYCYLTAPVEQSVGSGTAGLRTPLPSETYSMSEVGLTICQSSEIRDS